MMLDKKCEEMFFVRRFLEAESLNFEIFPGESPDFTLTSGTSRVGLEVTRIFHPAEIKGKPRKVVESLRDRVLSQAQRLYHETGNPPVHVSVFFKSGQPIEKSEVSPLARKLVSLVIRNLPDSDSCKKEEFNWTNRKWFPEELDQIMVWRFSWATKSNWSAPDSEHVPKCSIELIQESISKKNSKFSCYAETHPNCWLLIVADDFSLSGTFEFTHAVLAHGYTSNFERIYLVQPFSPQVYSLSALPPVP
jgi:hypothetical protein